MKLHTRIFIGLAAGMLLGAISKVPGVEGLQSVLIALEPIGTVFIRLITMVVVPFVIATLLVGISALGDLGRVGRIGGRTLVFFLATTLAGAAIGLATAQLTGVGQRMDPAVRDALAAQFQDRASSAVEAARETPGVIRVLTELVPANPFAAAAQADLLGLTIAVVIFGAALTVVEPRRRKPLVDFFESLSDVCMVVIRWLMRVAPVAVFALIAATVARFGLDLLRSLLFFCIVVLIALAVHVALVLVPLLRLGAGVGFGRFVRAVSDALTVAFSTASSNATLPVSMAAARDRLKIAPAIVSFVLPAGTKLNLNGAATYKAVAAVFLAHIYGLELDLTRQVVLVFAAAAGALAGVGVPGSSLITTVIVLNAIGLGPQAAAGIALVAGVDRPLDMCRTTVNVTSSLVAAAVINARSGEPPAGIEPVERAPTAVAAGRGG